jgi:hypothetical protein
MTRSSTDAHKIGLSKALHIVVFVIAMISFILNSSNARAASEMPADYRFAMAGDKFEDTWQLAVAFRMRSPRRLRAKYMELAVGTISTTEVNQPFVSFGPVWRLPINSRRLFVQLGFSPTLLGGSTFHGHDLGGKFHFTSCHRRYDFWCTRRRGVGTADSAHVERRHQKHQSRYGHDRAQPIFQPWQSMNAEENHHEKHI